MGKPQSELAQLWAPRTHSYLQIDSHPVSPGFSQTSSHLSAHQTEEMRLQKVKDPESKVGPLMGGPQAPTEPGEARGK